MLQQQLLLVLVVLLLVVLKLTTAIQGKKQNHRNKINAANTLTQAPNEQQRDNT